MPSPVIHLDLLVRWCALTHRSLTSELVLGAISPDAIHIRANQTWSDKAKTHFYEETEVSYVYALSVARQQLKEVSADFLMGYLIHLYTDYVWRDQVYAPYFHAHKDHIPRQTLYDYYYHDTAQLDQLVLSQASWLADMRSCLTSIHSTDIVMPLLTPQELMGWKDKVLLRDLASLGEREELGVLSLANINGVCEEILRQLVHLFEKT